MAGPTHNELQFHVDEIGWSLVSMCKHMFRSRVADVQGDDDTSQAAFDGAVLHVRAIVEFLGRTTGGHIHATHYCATWDGFATANALGFDMWDLYRTLNIHAAHLGRERFKKTPGNAWDLIPLLRQLLEVFRALLNCPNMVFEKELAEHFNEAQVHFARIPP